MTTPMNEQQRIQEAKACLKGLYISEPKRSKLAALPYINQEYIMSWHIYLSNNVERYRPGLLIYKLEQGEEVPDDDVSGYHFNDPDRE